MDRQPGGSCINLHVMPGLISVALALGGRRGVGKGESERRPCWGARGLGRPLIVKQPRRFAHFTGSAFLGLPLLGLSENSASPSCLLG